MRKFLKFFVLTWTVLVAHSGNCAPRDEDIYKSAIAVVVQHEKPGSYFIWNRYIGSDTILTARVPRHEPEHQFIRGLRGLPVELEQKLFKTRDTDSAQAEITPFSPPALKYQFAGFISRDKLQTIQKESQPEQAAHPSIVVGLSNVVYDDDEKNALVYAESCLVLSEPVCGGQGFWFKRNTSGWKIQKQAFLWQGVPNSPFWNANVATEESKLSK
jgi:hypothetical protein